MVRTKTDRVLVTGAGGFIGHHLVSRLKAEGAWVRGVDRHPPYFSDAEADEFVEVDLRDRDAALGVTEDVDDVYHLAADMGGIEYITRFHAKIAHNSTLINLNMLEAARKSDVARFLYSSSACVYPQYLQDAPDVSPLKEEDAWPADPEPGYGLEKLYMEKLCEYYQADYGLATRVVRFHNVYGPLGVFEGGKEKAPAAICRKIAEAPDGGEVEVWGDGQQTRTFMYIDDCVEGMHRIMESGHSEPLNLGRDELVTVDGLVDLVAEIAGKTIQKHHDTSKPQGVRGRDSDNSRIEELLGWSPKISLREGLGHTYRWIWHELDREGRARPPAPEITAPEPEIQAE